MKKTVSAVLAVILFAVFTLCAFAMPLYNDEVDVKSDIYLVNSANDGTVLFSRNADVPCQPAALLNIVTAMVVLNNVQDIENTAFAVPKETANMIAGTGVATMLLTKGESVCVKDLLYSILIRSAADSSITLAEGVGGTVENFVAMMNEYVRSLGCVSTNFVNVTGLDAEGQYTTATDMAVIIQNASENNTFREMTMTSVYQFQKTALYDSRRIFTTNLMIQSGYPDYYTSTVTCIKSGATEQAGRCVALTASKDGYSYVAVVMKGPFEDADRSGEKENYAFIDCKTMLNWTFRKIRLCEIANPSLTVAELPVRYSRTRDHVRLVPAGKLSLLLPSKSDTDSVVFRVIDEETEDEIKAPCPKGTIVGKAEVIYGEQVIEIINLATGDDLPFEFSGFVLGVIRDVFHSPVAVIALILAAAVIVVVVVRSRRNGKSGKRRGMKS